MKRLMSYSALSVLLVCQVEAQAPPAGGNGPPAPPVKFIPMALALEAVQTAVSVCTEKGQKVSVAIVDTAGNARALLVADGTNSMAARAGGLAKARTVLEYKMSTTELAEKMKTDEALKAEIDNKTKTNRDFRAGPGALPIKIGDEIVGAIGVGGGMVAGIDEVCAKAGLDKIQDRVK